MASEIAFRRVREPYGWLGNMSPHPVEWEGFTYPTAEHLFQCWRFVGDSRRWPPAEPHDPTPVLRDRSGLTTPAPVPECGYSCAVREVRALRSPMAAKMRAKVLRDLMVVTPRGRADVINMRRVLGLKLAQHPDLAAALLETGDSLIVEDCSARPSESGLFWGARRSGLGGGWSAAGQPGWEGQNTLGKLWMDLRAELRRWPSDEEISATVDVAMRTRWGRG